MRYAREVSIGLLLATVVAGLLTLSRFAWAAASAKASQAQGFDPTPMVVLAASGALVLVLASHRLVGRLPLGVAAIALSAFLAVPFVWQSLPRDLVLWSFRLLGFECTYLVIGVLAAAALTKRRAVWAPGPYGPALEPGARPWLV